MTIKELGHVLRLGGYSAYYGTKRKVLVKINFKNNLKIFKK
jgi:hypothetical protein